MAQLLKPYHFSILFLLVTFPAVLAMLFLPSLPTLGIDFSISPTKAQWTVAIFLGGYSIGQLPYGPLANRIGRKKTIYCGVALAFIGSLAAFLSTHFWILCGARFIQAFGAAMGLALSFTIISDELQGKSATRAIAILSLAFAVMPGLAIALGGWISFLSGWRGCFLFLTFYSIFLGLICFLLPETVKKIDPHALRVHKLIDGYKTQFKNAKVVLFAILAAAATSVIYIFATLAPYIGINVLHLSPQTFGVFNLIPMSGLLLASLVTRMLAGQHSHMTNILTGFGLMFLATSVIFVCFFTDNLNIWSLFLPQFVNQFGCGYLWTNACAAGASTLTNKANGSAVMQFINMGGTTAASFLVGIFSPTHLLLLPLVFGTILLIVITIWLILKSHVITP